MNRAFLEKVATSALGKSYFLNDPSGLEQILLRDVEEHTGITAVEKTDPAEGGEAGRDPGRRGHGKRAGAARVRALQPRPTADTILKADHGDPLLVRWQYGLGRPAVFTSDAKNRWARELGDVARVRPLLGERVPRPAAARAAERDHGRFRPRVQRTGGGLPAVAQRGRSRRRCPISSRSARAASSAPLKVSKVAAGHYRGRLAIGQNQGLFRVRPLVESRAFPEVGFYRQEDEMTEYGNNEQLLREIAAATGGRFRPGAKAVFDAAGRSIRTTMNLWPGLLALAVLVNLAELILRKWNGVAEALHLKPLPA